MNKKKITIRFFLYILGGAALGACLSLGTFLCKGLPFKAVFRLLYRTACKLPMAWYSSRPVRYTSGLRTSGKSEKCIADWNGWNDDTDDTFYRKTEVLLNISIGISSLAMMLYFMVVCAADHCHLWETYERVLVFCVYAVFPVLHDFSVLPHSYSSGQCLLKY